MVSLETKILNVKMQLQRKQAQNRDKNDKHRATDVKQEIKMFCSFSSFLWGNNLNHIV